MNAIQQLPQPTEIIAEMIKMNHARIYNNRIVAIKRYAECGVELAVSDNKSAVMVDGVKWVGSWDYICEIVPRLFQPITWSLEDAPIQ